MFEHVVFWCGRPCCSDPELDFQCLLLVERDSLAQIFHAFVLSQYFYAHLNEFNMPLDVRIHGALVAENLRLVWVDPESHFLGCFLEFVHHIPQLFFGGCEQHHVVGKSQIREAVPILVAQVKKHSFFLLPFLYFVLQWVLKHRVEQQAGHRISLLGTFLDVENFSLFVCLYWSLLVSVNFPQEAGVFVIDNARFECLPNRIGRDGVESLSEVDRRSPHFDSPLLAFLFNQSVCCKVVRCLVSFSDSSLIFCLFLVKHWV